MSRPLQLGSNENRDSYNFLVILNDLEQTLSVLNLESTDGSVSGTGYIDASGNSTNNDIKYFVTKKGITTGYQNLNFDYICQFSSVNSYILSSSVFDSNLYDLSFLPKTIKDIYDLNSGITTNETITFDSPNIPSIPTTIVKIPGDCVTNCEVIETLPFKVKEQSCESQKSWRILLEINPENLAMNIKFNFKLEKNDLINCRTGDEKSLYFDLRTKYKNSRTSNILAEQLKSSESSFTNDGCLKDIDNGEILSNLIGKFDVFYITNGSNNILIDPKFSKVPTMYDMESRFQDDTIAVGISETVSRATNTLLEYGRYVNCFMGAVIEKYTFGGSIELNVNQNISNSEIGYIGGWATRNMFAEMYGNKPKEKGVGPKFSSDKSIRNKYGSKTFDSKSMRGIQDVLKKIPAEVDRFCDIPPCSISERYKYAKHLLDSKLVKGGILITLIDQLFKDVVDAMDHKECPCPEQ